MSEIERNPVYPLALNSDPILGIRFIYVLIPITGLALSTYPGQNFPARFDEIPDKYLMRRSAGTGSPIVNKIYTKMF